MDRVPYGSMLSVTHHTCKYGLAASSLQVWSCVTSFLVCAVLPRSVMMLTSRTLVPLQSQLRNARSFATVSGLELNCDPQCMLQVDEATSTVVLDTNAGKHLVLGMTSSVTSSQDRDIGCRMCPTDTYALACMCRAMGVPWAQPFRGRLHTALSPCGAWELGLPCKFPV